MKTTDLIGPALAWAVGVAEGYELSLYGVDPSIRARVPGLGVHAPWRPDTYWNQGGPIIEREGISTVWCDDDYGTDARGFCNNMRNPVWASTTGQHGADESYGPQGDNWGRSYNIDADEAVYGPTHLIAAMRCYVASKLGAEIDVPPELTK